MQAVTISGTDNTAIGAFALDANTTGTNNTAVGRDALGSTNTGLANTAVGRAAMSLNTTGHNNVAIGFAASERATDGSANIAVGRNALHANLVGTTNTAVGHFSLSSTTGSNNTALGSAAGINLTTGDDNIMIGNAGVAAESNTIRIGTPGTHTTTHLTGNVLIDGAPIGSPFSAEGLNYMTLAAAAFRPTNPTDDCVNFGSAAWCNQQATLRAPINLPDGVVMSEVTCYGRDSDPARDFQASGQVILIPSTNTTGFNSCSSAGSPGATECSINVAPGLRVIDQQTAGYFITFTHPGGGDLVRLNACRIAFEL